MQKLNSLILLNLLFCCTVQGQNAVQICFDENCSIAINGESNVSTFTCSLVELPVSENPIAVNTSYKNGKLDMNNVKVKLASKGFKCNNQAMNADFQKALKTKEYPFISLFFSYLYFEHQPTKNDSYKNIVAQISLNIAGVTRKYKVVLKEVEFENDALKIKGIINLKMSDFNIEPPQALFGMIKSKDELAIQFKLQFCVK